MFRFAFCLFLFASIPLYANLGDSVDQCVKRYGKPVGYSEANPKFPFGTLVFKAGSYTLVLFLHGEKEVGARVSKKDDSAFSPAELKTIMDADTMGAGWTASTSADLTCDRWTRGDKATALYDHDKHVIIFTSDEMANLAPTAVPATNAPPRSPAPPPQSAPAPAPAGG